MIPHQRMSEGLPCQAEAFLILQDMKYKLYVQIILIEAENVLKIDSLQNVRFYISTGVRDLAP